MDQVTIQRSLKARVTLFINGLGHVFPDVYHVFKQSFEQYQYLR